MFKATAICHLIRSICIGKYALIMYYSMIWCMKYVNTNMICHLYNVQNQIVQSQHAVSKKVLRWRMGPSVDKHLWKTHHVPLHGSNPYQFWFTVDMADSAERKEYWLLDTLSNFKVASHHKSPVTGIVLVKFVVRYKSWLLPRKSNKSMRYAFLCGKISLWTYFATQWDDLATGRSMPSVPHCSLYSGIVSSDVPACAWQPFDPSMDEIEVAPCHTASPRNRPKLPKITFLERASSSSWWHSIFGSRYHNKLCLVTVMDSPASFSTCSASARSAITSHGPPNRLVYAGSHNGGEMPWPPISSPPAPFSTPSRPYVF